MLTINVIDGKKTIQQIMDEHFMILCREMINSICDAIDKDVPKVLVAILISPSGNEFDITASESFYRNCLEANMCTMIEVEEYELCARAKEYIDILDSRN